MNDGSGVGGLLDALHETAVDLELVEGEAAQVQKARIAGAEIVERQAHSQRLEPAHGSFRAVHIAEQRTLGELQLEPRRVESRVVEDPLDHVDEIDLAKLKRRYVDRNRNA